MPVEFNTIELTMEIVARIVRPGLSSCPRILQIAFALAAAGASAAPQTPQPGMYVREHASGTLAIKRNEQNALTFEISSIGGNCHTCEVSGVIRGSVGNTTDAGEEKCEISFSAKGAAVAVNPLTQEACREYCGARAVFDGTYIIPHASCTNAGMQARRDQFMRLYRAHKYPDAIRTLQSLMSECEKFMDWIELDKARNDLAISQYHNGESAQCLQTLNATLAGHVKGEEELKSGANGTYLPPCDFDNYIDVAKSTWYNRSLCSKGMAKKE
jgi:hypothetical protein